LNKTIHFIEGLKKHDNAVLREIYRSYEPTVSKFVLKNNGSLEDGKDVFQKALLSVYERIKKDNKFKIEGEFGAYLFGVARFIWFKELKRKNKELSLTKTELLELNNKDKEWEEFEQAELDSQKHILFWQSFSKLGDSCQKLLRAYFQKLQMKEIASLMNLSVGGVRVKKVRCIKKLKQLIIPI